MAKRPGGLGKGLGAIFIENDNEESNGAVKLKISEIEPNRSQPRKDFDEEALSELADSISKHGLLQPILVRPLTLGGYEIVAGERRYRASRMAGLTEVPVIIRELSEAETMELALIENLQREDLTPLEEAEGYQALMSEHGMTQEEVARQVGKSRPAVANAVRLLGLPRELAQYVEADIISAGHARALLGLSDPEEMKAVADKVAQRQLSVRQTEELVRQINKAKPEQENPPQALPDVDYSAIAAKELEDSLGRKVKIVSGKRKGKLELEYYGVDDLNDLLEALHQLPRRG